MTGNAGRATAIWIATALFLIYQNTLNLLFGLDSGAVGASLRLGPLELGLMAAAFGYAYGALQIPVGVLFDRLDPRRLLAGAAVLCALGALLFSHADGFASGLAGRTLMGLGAALAYVGASTLMALWWPSRLALMLGLTQLLDALGSAAAEPLLAAAGRQLDWRQLHAAAAFLGIVIACGLWLAVRRPVGFVAAPGSSTLLATVRQVARRPPVWLAALYASGTIGTIFSYGMIWDIDLQRAFGNDLQRAAAVNAWLFVGFGLGAAAFGALSARGISAAPLMVLPALAAALVLSLLIFLPRIEDRLVVVGLSVALGVGCSAAVVAYEIVALGEPPQRRGTAIGLVNAVAFFAAAGLQALHGRVALGDLAAMQRTLWIYPLLLLVAAGSGWLLALRKPAVTR